MVGVVLGSVTLSKSSVRSELVGRIKLGYCLRA